MVVATFENVTQGFWCGIPTSILFSGPSITSIDVETTVPYTCVAHMKGWSCCLMVMQDFPAVAEDMGADPIRRINDLPV